MPKTQFQRMFFALVTVLITVHGYVFYSLYVVNGSALMAATGASGVLEAIRRQGGIMLLGRMTPIWGIVLVEFCLAFLLEVVLVVPAPSGWPAGSLIPAPSTRCCSRPPSSAPLWG